MQTYFLVLHIGFLFIYIYICSTRDEHIHSHAYKIAASGVFEFETWPMRALAFSMFESFQLRVYSQMLYDIKK